MRHYMVDPDNEERLLKVPPRVVARIKAEAYAEAVEAVKTYAEETHQHYGDLFGQCRQEYGDRCDITAALRSAVQRIEALGGER